MTRLRHIQSSIPIVWSFLYSVTSTEVFEHKETKQENSLIKYKSSGEHIFYINNIYSPNNLFCAKPHGIISYNS